MAELPIKKNLYVLQALRGLAALAVIGFHVNESLFGLTKYWADRPFGRIFDFGHAGVEFFFVLSGFIILTAHRHDIGNPGRVISYIWKRFRRIYPIYWVVLAMVTPAFFINPSFGGSAAKTTAATLIDSVLLIRLLPSDNQVLDVSWTLFHEILFYAVFSLLVVSSRVGAIVLALWMFSSLGVLIFGQHLPEMVQFYLSPLHLLFAMGMASAELVRRRWVPLPLLQLGGGMVLFLAVAIVDTNLGNPRLIWLSISYGVCSALILSAVVELELNGLLRVPKAMVLLGDASYSIYLIHLVVLSLLAKLLLHLTLGGLALPHRLMFILLFVASACAGLLFYVLVERRLLAFIALRRVGQNVAHLNRSPASRASTL